MTPSILFLFSFFLGLTSTDSDRGISKQQLENWASKFGGPLSELARSVTKYKEIHLRFQQSRDSFVTKIDLPTLLEEMKGNIEDHFQERVEALEKLQLEVEQRALYYNLKGPPKDPQPLNYYSAKRINREPDKPPFDRWGANEKYPINLPLHEDKHFRTPVNFSTSTVHVPTSIYDEDKTVLHGVEWSSDIDDVFTNNLKEHPTLNWQYFGSVTGFMRQYPAMAWPKNNSDDDNIDLFDCRLRPWYTAAANSPKNLVILQDTSGSMTGRRREIAKHVVYTILDTLTDNDFVNVYNFSKNATPIVPCFNNTLVQASLENIREFKVALDQDSTQQTADHGFALETAFELLQSVNDTESSGCNQAIMLITDGSPYYHEGLIDKLQTKMDPAHSVRIFTYLIGKEVTDFREVRWMACANRGYFVHVSTLGEVQEQVLKYLPVMSRPMVIEGRRDITWTPVYASFVGVTSPTRFFWLVRRSDDGEPKTEPSLDMMEEDWAWEAEVKAIQRVRSEYFKRLIKSSPKSKSFPGHKLNLPSVPPHRASPQSNEFEFVISASIPVFDLRNRTSDGKLKPNSNETFSTAKDRIANFLGVVGTDVPETELKRLTTPFKLGVNGYAFIVTNNGHVVLHPNWRPAIRSSRGDILKPNYNSVDLMEVELIDSNVTVRNNDSILLEVRREIVMKDRSFRKLRVRIPQDDFRRVTIRTHEYEYNGIDNTPFTLGLSIPDRAHWFKGEIEVSRIWKDEGKDVTHFFDHPADTGRNWSINPNWHYCDYIRVRSNRTVPRKNEERIIQFLREIQLSSTNWRWKNTGVGLNKNVRHANKRHLEEDIYECDRELVQSLVFDANVTSIFTSGNILKFNKNESIIEMYGALLVFIATRSGLTRWIGLPGNYSENEEGVTNNRPPFGPYATESLWYQRAVDRYEIDPNSFVYSVPINAGDKIGTRVTATRAVFVTKHGKRAPVAVVGIQFDHQKWSDHFREVTGTCMEGRDCQKTCASPEFDCYVLDDNGFILITTRQTEDTGRFFGEVNGMVMEMMVNLDVYKRVRVFDFQATCSQSDTFSSPANFLVTPFSHLKWFFSWLFTHLVYITLNWNLILAEVLEDIDGTSSLHANFRLNKTRLTPCDEVYDLYTYGPSYNSVNFSYHGILNKCGNNCDGHFNVHYIQNTNLILVVTDGTCPCGLNATTITPRVVPYEVVNGTKDLCRIPRMILPRKRPEPCCKFNPEEKDLMEDCGRGGRISFWTFQLSLSILFHFLITNTITSLH